jgi:hypothetical protein
MTEAPEHITPLPDTHVDNGILARVPAQYLGAATNSLPDPTTATEDVMCVEVDTTKMWHGRVRLSFKRALHRQPSRKKSWWSWQCFHAERIE